jgi:glutathione peroxidase
MAQLDYTTSVTRIDGTHTDLAAYRGKVLLIVNTASKCGYTPQLEGLQSLYAELGDQGFEVLGFPCGQFRDQELGSDDEIEQFCQINYGVTFPMHAKIDVNGPRTHPLFAQLKDAKRGLLGSQSIKWNFTKFLVGRDGTILARFGTPTTPEKLRPKVERALER